jgi:RND superfamily putative drug exporter
LFFDALGRFAVRYRVSIVAFWLVATFLCVHFLPSLSSVSKSDNSAFLPSSAPSVQAGNLSAAFQHQNVDTATLVVSRPGSPLSTADQATVSRVEAQIAKIPLVTAVRDRGTSADGQARRALIETSVRSYSRPGATKAVVDGIRAQLAPAAQASGLSMHLTGTLAIRQDVAATNHGQQNRTEWLSIIFILLLLAFVFRSVLAPLLTLFPAALALVLANPLIAEAAKVGVQVSDFTQFMLIVIVLGAGTDYGLFLIFRVREEISAGLDPKDAVGKALSRVGESITYSGSTVIVAFVTLLIATFGLYRGLGPGLAIGIFVVLVMDLTLLPALLALFGRAAFWPTTPAPGRRHGGSWGRIAGRVTARPVPTLIAGLLIFGGLALANLAYAPAGFGGDNTAPAHTDSALGDAALAAHFPAAELNPTPVVFAFGDSVWHSPQVLAQAGGGLQRTGVFASVAGPLDPNGTRLTPAQLAALHDRLAPLGPAASLPPVPPPGTGVAAADYQAYRATAQFVTPDGRTVQYFTTLRAGPPDSDQALQAVPSIRAAVTQVAHQAGAAQSGVAGQAASVYDVSRISSTDLKHVIPLVLVVIALLLVALLRSLVAPLYLIASVGLSYLAALGFAVLAFVVIGGSPGINFVLPFFMFVFLMALGEDYNILVMSRIREEAHNLPLRAAVRRAIEATGTTVTSAGLILAGTFLVLTVATTGSTRQIGIALAVGVLLDTFLVRSLLVPSTVVLLGRWNWWPSRLWKEETGGGVPDETAEPELVGQGS